jgi:hypothetical protein
MLQSEAKSYYRLPEEERQSWAYHDARLLMQHFGFEDLVVADGAAWAAWAAEAPEPEPLSPKEARERLREEWGIDYDQPSA